MQAAADRALQLPAVFYVCQIMYEACGRSDLPFSTPQYTELRTQLQTIVRHTSLCTDDAASFQCSPHAVCCSEDGPLAG